MDVRLFILQSDLKTLAVPCRQKFGRQRVRESKKQD